MKSSAAKVNVVSTLSQKAKLLKKFQDLNPNTEHLPVFILISWISDEV